MRIKSGALLVACIRLAMVFSLGACASPSSPRIPDPTTTPAPTAVPSGAATPGLSAPPIVVTPMPSPQPPVATVSATPSPGGAPVRTDPLAQVPACPSDISEPLFDTIPIDPNDFLAFRPLGFMSPPIHMFPAKHSAFSMTPLGQKPVAKPVRAPGRVWVVEIWEASFSTGAANYQVFVYPCREVRVYFGHVVSLSEKLMAEFRKSEPTCNSFSEGTTTITTCRRDGMSLLLEAGEQFGMGPDTAGVDFGVVDFRRTPAAFINVEHYDRYYPYYASPLDYYAGELRRTLEGKTGHVFGTTRRTAEPIGGTYMQDVPGTAQGNWFVPGKNHRNSTDLSPMLGLAHDYVDPAQPIMAIGNSIKGVNMGLYSFRVATDGLVNRDFGEVKADGRTYCYDSFVQGQSAGGMPLGRPSGILLVSMPSDTTLKVELVAGSSCSALANRALTGNATTFER